MGLSNADKAELLAEVRNDPHGTPSANEYATPVQAPAKTPQQPQSSQRKQPAKRQSPASGARGGSAQRNQRAKRAGGTPQTAPRNQAGGGLNQYVGLKVRRKWPGEGWCEGIITDYSPVTNEHTIAYDLNTPHETVEEGVLGEFTKDECVITNERIDKDTLDSFSYGQPSTWNGQQSAQGRQRELSGLDKEINDMEKDLMVAPGASKLADVKAKIDAHLHAVEGELKALGDDDTEDDETEEE